ncbi:hypothetical protein, partial [Rhodobacter viridis]|uniref:hypothetical protein n=1 Tax=Rhodobacter viridis TaxID=1054202 RepID=UPI001C6538FA
TAFETGLSQPHGVRGPRYASLTSCPRNRQQAIDPDLIVEAIDTAIAEQVWSRARARLGATEFEFDRRRHEFEERIVPYPVIMQTIVDRLTRGDDYIKA